MASNCDGVTAPYLWAFICASFYRLQFHKLSAGRQTGGQQQQPAPSSNKHRLAHVGRCHRRARGVVSKAQPGHQERLPIGGQSIAEGTG